MTEAASGGSSAPRPAPLARATVADVARLAGVSLKTASRALSDSPNVKASTRSRVLDAARTLRFRPNALARELRQGGVASTLGFVIGDIANPFYSAVAAGVGSAISERGLTLVMAATDDREDLERPTVGSMLERRVFALLLVPIAEDHSYLEGERHLGTPIIAVDRPLSNAASDSVLFDNRGGARSGVLALFDAGHRRIGYVGSSPHLYTDLERLEGYRDAHAVRGATVDKTLIREDAVTIDAAERATAELLASPEPPDAIFSANNRATVGVYRAIRARGGGTGLIGFDDFELAETLGISVVAHSPREMGRHAAELAIKRREHAHGSLERIVLPTRLVLRESHVGAARH